MRSLDTFEKCRAASDALNAEMEPIEKRLNAFPRGAMGLTPDEAKTPEWHALRKRHAALFAALRRVNAHTMKYFKKEAVADSKARRAAKLASMHATA